IQACQYKGRIVEADEHEAAQRAFLNFGHTIGHALEAATSYARYLHGEAVAIGMVCAGRIACDLRMLDAKDLERMRRLIVAAGLPDRFDRSIPSEAIFEHLQWDKKVQDGRMRFILPQNIGRVVVRESVKPELIRRVLEESRSE
ncbi:MAG: 3-dehydroquinate synthase, partial [bacterium]